MAAWQQFAMNTAPAEPAQGDSDDDDPTVYKGNQGQLAFHGNERTMNMNPLILTNVQGSPYFKVDLFGKKTFHEVVDEIYYRVDHLEPWATGSRKTAGRSQTGMCGGVRGVSAGGIVSSAYCLLFKLYTLKMTKKQVMSLLNHCDSPYIRGIGFMYLRYTLPAANLWDWFEPYLDDQEEIDIKAGGGKPMTIGEMGRQMLTRLEWFDTRFPRIAVNFEKQIRDNLDHMTRDSGGYRGNQPDYAKQNEIGYEEMPVNEAKSQERDENRMSRDRDSKSRNRDSDRKSRDRDQSRDRKSKDRKSRDRSRSRDRRRDRSRSRDKKKKDRSRDRSRDKHHKKHKRSRSKDRSRRSRSRDKGSRDKHSRDRDDFSQELRKYKEDSHKHKKHSRRSRSRS